MEERRVFRPAPAIHRSSPLLRVAAGLALFAAPCPGCGDGKLPVASSHQHFIAARDFLAAGEKDKALVALDASIASEPTTWAFLERAKLHADLGDGAAALADCQAGLKLDPQDADLLWLAGELAKPPAGRFQGKFQRPPSMNR
jgi:hypothetical protein